MPTSRSSRVKLVGLLSLVALLVIAAAALSACGDPYSGEWTGDIMGEEFTIKVEKKGDSWELTAPGESDGDTITATEKDGKLVASDPDNPGTELTIEVDGDTMTMSSGGVSFELKKK